MRKYLFLLLAACLALFSSCQGGKERKDGRLVITALDFPSYDAVRAVTGDLADIRMILPPGMDSHGYEPGPEDMVAILSSDLFVYCGGESDHWMDGILNDMDGEVAVFSLLEHSPVVLMEDESGVIEAEDGEGHGHDDVYDEHVWTSLSNEIAIIEALCGTISGLDPENAGSYGVQSGGYVARIEELRTGFTSLFEQAGHPLMVVADRFPLIYFVSEFDIPYLAAFPGCAEESEPSARTVAYLIDRIRADGVESIFHMELSNTMLCDLIADETGAGVYLFNSCHNVTKRQFDQGVTYVDLMEENLETLKEAFL